MRFQSGSFWTHADFLVSWAWRKEIDVRHIFVFHLKVERRKKRRETREASQQLQHNNIYKIDKLLWALTWGSSSSYFSSFFRPPERWAEEKLFRGGLVVKRRDLKVATMCRYNGLITTNIERKGTRKERTCSNALEQQQHREEEGGKKE